MGDRCDCCRFYGDRKLSDGYSDVLANESFHELGFYDFAHRHCQSDFTFVSQAESYPGIHRQRCRIDDRARVRLCLDFLVFIQSVRSLRVDECVFRSIRVDAMDVVCIDGLAATTLPGAMDS